MVTELVNARSRDISESVGLTLLLHLCFQSGFWHRWRFVLNQWPKLRAYPALAPVATRYSLWVPDNCGHKCYTSLFLSNRALAGFRESQPQIRVKGPCKAICSLTGFWPIFMHLIVGWLADFPAVWSFFFPLLSSWWIYMLARWSQAGAGYLASLCFLIVLFLQKSSCGLLVSLF